MALRRGISCARHVPGKRKPSAGAAQCNLTSWGAQAPERAPYGSAPPPATHFFRPPIPLDRPLAWNLDFRNAAPRVGAALEKHSPPSLLSRRLRREAAEAAWSASELPELSAQEIPRPAASARCAGTHRSRGLGQQGRTTCRLCQRLRGTSWPPQTSVVNSALLGNEPLGKAQRHIRTRRHPPTPPPARLSDHPWQRPGHRPTSPAAKLATSAVHGSARGGTRQIQPRHTADAAPAAKPQTKSNGISVGTGAVAARLARRSADAHSDAPRNAGGRLRQTASQEPHGRCPRTPSPPRITSALSEVRLNGAALLSEHIEAV